MRENRTYGSEGGELITSRPLSEIKRLCRAKFISGFVRRTNGLQMLKRCFNSRMNSPLLKSSAPVERNLFRDLFEEQTVYKC